MKRHLSTGSFYYPELDRLPRIASVRIVKVKEFKLRKDFKEVVEVKRDGNRIEDWGLPREVQPLQHWAGEKEKSRKKDKDWGLEARQGHGIVVGDLNVIGGKEELYSKILRYPVQCFFLTVQKLGCFSFVFTIRILCLMILGAIPHETVCCVK